MQESPETSRHPLRAPDFKSSGPIRESTASRRLASAALQHLREHAVLYAGLLIYLLAVIYVDPFRPKAEGDEWAYALTVRTLLQTGRYHPHDWVAANPVFQVYWGALFSMLFGFSFVTLRISTIVLAIAGAAAFYNLLREHRIQNGEAGLLTFALLCSPLAFQFSLEFMTDVPFLTLTVAAVLFYTRAVRLHSYRVMLIGSVLGCLAVLTRQFGVGIVMGLGLAWLLSRTRKTELGLFLLGMILPVMGVLWQLYVGFLHPNWTMPMKSAQELIYVRDPAGLLFSTLWRPAVISMYLALYTSPILLFAGVKYAGELISRLRRPLQWAPLKRELVILACFAFFIGSAVTGGWLLGLQPIRLAYLPWSGLIFTEHPRFAILMTVLAFGGALLLGRLFVMRYAALRTPPFSDDGHKIIDLVTVGLLLVLVSYVDLYDWYLLCLVPYALLVLGLYMKERWDAYKTGMGLACVGLLAASALWTRPQVDVNAAYWKASDYLLHRGIPASQIATEWEWTAYHQFDDYLADINYKIQPDLRDFFFRWHVEQSAQASYAVSKNCPAAGRVLIAVPYQTMSLETKYLCAYKK